MLGMQFLTSAFYLQYLNDKTKVSRGEEGSARLASWRRSSCEVVVVRGGSDDVAAGGVLGYGGEAGLVPSEDVGGFNGVLWWRWRGGSIVLHSTFVGSYGSFISSRYDLYLMLPIPS